MSGRVEGLGTLELAEVVPAGRKHGTDVAAGLIKKGSTVEQLVPRAGRHRKHIPGMVRLPVARPDLDHQSLEEYTARTRIST